MARPRKTLDERLREVYAREEAVEKAAEALARRARALEEKAAKLALQADAVMAQAEAEIEARAARAVEKAEAAAMPRFTAEHHEVARRLALGLPALEGGRPPTAREVTAALQLLATLDQKAREREDRMKGSDGGPVVFQIVNPYAESGVVEMEVRATDTESEEDAE